MIGPPARRYPYHTVKQVQNMERRPSGSFVSQLKNQFLPIISNKTTSSNQHTVSNIIMNIQQVLKVVETTAPLIKQYGPVVKNVPAMIKMMKAFKELEKMETETEKVEGENTLDVANEIESTDKIQEEDIMNSNYKNKKKGISEPKLFI